MLSYTYPAMKAVDNNTSEKLLLDNDLIRLQIDNTDNELSQEQISEIIENLSRLTSRLSRKYKISNERFKLITGRSLIEKLFNVA